MNASTKRRIVIYGVAALAVFGLGFASLQAKARSARHEIGTLLNGGELLAKLGVFDKADEAANAVLEREPENRDARLLLAYTAQQRGDRVRAVSHYREALARSDNDEQRRMIAVTIADVLRADGRREEAAREIDECRKAWGDSSRLAMAEAALWSVQGRHDDAVARIEVACADETMFPRAQLTKAWILRSATRNEEALATLERIGASDANAPTVWFEIASVRLALGNRAGAVEAMTESANRYPNATRRLIAQEQDTWANILPNSLFGATPMKSPAQDASK